MAIECVETQEWIEEEISKPIEEFEERTKEKCSGSKWNPLNWICKLVTYVVKVVRWVVVKVGKWVVRTVCKIVGAFASLISNLASGLWNIVAGIFTRDWRRILDGLIEIGSGLLDFALTIFRVVTLGDTVDYIAEEYNRGKLRDYVDKLLAGKYSNGELKDIREALRTKHGAFGYRITMAAVRTYLDSETLSPTDRQVPNLVILHESNTINLYELCGFAFTEGFWNRKRYKTIKKGPFATGGGGGEPSNPISEEELDLYLSSRGADGPKFFVFSVDGDVLKTKLRAAELSARDIGLIPRWTKRDLEVNLPDEINHEDDETLERAALALVSFLTDRAGREPKIKIVNMQPVDNLALALQDLCTPMAASVFRFKGKGRGYSTCLIQSASGQGPDNACGVTFIDNKPDQVWKYIPIHELGHYFGLNHVSGVERIMYSTKADSWFAGWTLPKLLYTKGEPSFTLGEAKLVWDYIVDNFPANCLK